MTIWRKIKAAIFIEAAFLIMRVIRLEEKLLMWSHRNDDADS
jgi:hypothetical protein